MMILSLIISCLFALAPISNVPQIEQDKQSNVQVVEQKHKSNYFDIYTDSNGTYYRYSLNALLSESYWANMIASFNTMGDIVIPNGDGSNYTYNDVLNDNKVYIMNSTLYSRFNFYYISNNSLVSIPNTSNNCFTYVSLYCQNSSYSMKVFYLHIYYTYTGNNGDYLISCLYNPVTNSFSTRYTLTGQSLSVVTCFGFPSSDNPLALQEGTANSFDNGYNSGYDYGYNYGYDLGYGDGLEDGFELGVDSATDPSSSTYQTIYQNGYQTGYSEGLEEGQDLDTTAAVIFSGFIEVGLLPVNVLLKMFEYEVFGINIAGLISGLFTLAIGIIIIRTITGKKND